MRLGVKEGGTFQERCRRCGGYFLSDDILPDIVWMLAEFRTNPSLSVPDD